MVNFNHIKYAHNRISNFIHNTPILTCENINKETNTNLFFKCDNFQKTGSFKIRGATNTILQLSKQQLTNGVITTSSGNHGAAVALAATRLGANVKVIMPNNTPKVKIDNVQRYGGEIIFCEPNIKARENMLKTMVQETGSTIVHPYNDEKITEILNNKGYIIARRTVTKYRELLKISVSAIFKSLCRGLSEGN